MAELRDGRRHSPVGKPMHRIPADDEHRDMGEGLCMTCMGVTAEWRTECGGWQECDDCADVDGEDLLNEAKRMLGRARCALLRSDLTPMARAILRATVTHREHVVAELRKEASDA